jgi:hypothetical protein
VFPFFRLPGHAECESSAYQRCDDWVGYLHDCLLIPPELTITYALSKTKPSLDVSANTICNTYYIIHRAMR